MKVRNITEMPTTHPYLEVTHYTVHKGVVIFFFQGYEPEEDESKTRAVAGWRARIGENQHGDHVTLVDGLGKETVAEAYDILFDQAVWTVDHL